MILNRLQMFTNICFFNCIETKLNGYLMKEINLVSLIHAYKELNQDLFSSYTKYFSIDIRNSELEDLESFISQLQSISNNQSIFDKYFVGFIIPQIGKEFDLLRIGEKQIINIELKKTNTDKVLKQLIQNRYYLSFLQKELYNFTYITDEKKLFTVNSENKLIEINIKELYEILSNQKVLKLDFIENLFNPSNYLVSPFNSPDEFLKGNYFLTSHQETIKNEVINIYEKKTTPFISIKGGAGTGKTLLTYDIAKEFISKNIKTLIIHCGILNDGHNALRGSDWDIIAARNIFSQKLSIYSVIIIDECQRIYPNQLQLIIGEIQKNSGIGIFSYDSQQYLRNWEFNNNIEKFLEEDTLAKTFELATKIRTNKEIASFIRGLFDKGKLIEKQKYLNIYINYFNNNVDAVHYIEQLRTEGWKMINYTPSTRDILPYEIHKIESEPDNSHTVIGQEFDNVIVVIDKYFYYNENRLSTRDYKKKPYYHPTQMLFQHMTRTRKKLNFIIINNPEVLERCLSLIKF